VVLAGEGNGDALVTAGGIMIGGALAHSLRLASSAAGSTERGQVAVVIGLVVCIAYAYLVTRYNRRQIARV
jgi:hypothetical protein